MPLSTIFGHLIWTTKKGKRIPLKEMEDSHLINAYRMVCRVIIVGSLSSTMKEQLTWEKSMLLRELNFRGFTGFNQVPKLELSIEETSNMCLFTDICSRIYD